MEEGRTPASSTGGENYLKVFPPPAWVSRYRALHPSHATLVSIGLRIIIRKGQQKLRILQLSSQYSTNTPTTRTSKNQPVPIHIYTTFLDSTNPLKSPTSQSPLSPPAAIPSQCPLHPTKPSQASPTPKTPSHPAKSLPKPTPTPKHPSSASALPAPHQTPPFKTVHAYNGPQT